MKYLFLDNFRGFSNTHVPLVDVNFCVGENSSGKTSVLEVVRMLSSPRLFMGSDFGGEGIEFSHFNDLVSIHAQDRGYFRVGLADERLKNKVKEGGGVLFTYKEKDGLPEVSRFTCSSGNQERHLSFIGDKVFYKSQPLAGTNSAEDMIKKIMPQWIAEHRTEGTGWASLDFPPAFRQIPLFMILAIALQTDKITDKASKEPEPDVYVPQFGPNQMAWIAPIRTKPRRTYDELRTAFSAEGSHTPYVIRRLLSSRTDAKKFKEFMSQVGKASGLFESIQVNYFGNKKNITSPFEVDAVLDSKALNLNAVGYGVSQSLPIFVELIDRPANSWFAIQQPEVHLHPRAQAALGDVFFEMAVRDNKRFLIETHSDFTIDRFKMNYRKKGTRKPNSQVLFFERKNTRNTLRPLVISPSGDLPRDQPDGYRRFFVKEEMRLLGL
jgi:predicted ATPase